MNKADQSVNSLQNKKPFFLQLQITGKCNLRCTHCYDATNKPIDMTLEKSKIVLDKFISLTERWGREFKIWISGGEPTVSSYFWDILEYLRDYYPMKKNISISLLTNGTLLTHDFIMKLVSFPMMEAVQVSIDGVTSETHESIRGQGNFDKAINTINRLVKTRLQTHIHFVVHKDNYEDSFLLTDFAKQLDIDVLTVTRLIPCGRGREMQDKMLTTEETYKLFKKLSDDFDSIIKDCQNGFPKPYIARNKCDWPVIYDKPDDQQSRDKNGSSCGIGHSYISIMENGDVHPCRRLPIKIGNIFIDELEQIWNSPLLWKFRQRKKYIKGKCKTCYFNLELPHVCSGGAPCISYGYYNDAFLPDPQCGIKMMES